MKPVYKLIGFRVDVAHDRPRWFLTPRLDSAIAEYECWRDDNDYGARDIGGAHDLYLTNWGVQDKTKLGFVSYNGARRYEGYTPAAELTCVFPDMMQCAGAWYLVAGNHEYNITHPHVERAPHLGDALVSISEDCFDRSDVLAQSNCEPDTGPVSIPDAILWLTDRIYTHRENARG